MLTSKNVYKTPYQLLIDSNISALPVRVSEICKQHGWTLTSYDGGKNVISSLGLSHLTSETDGFCLRNRGKYYILYDRRLSIQRQRFIVAHEIGHIALGHVDGSTYTRFNRPPAMPDSAHELAANLYAARLVAPAPVLHAIHATSVDEIAAVCGLTHTAAAFCAEYSASDNAILGAFDSYIRRILWQ